MEPPELEKQEVDIRSFLGVELKRLDQLFIQKNHEHKSLLTEADLLRDEVLRIDGARKNINQLLARVKEVTSL